MNQRHYDLGFEMNRAHRRDLGEVRAQERLARR